MCRSFKQNRRNGFTLVELLIVIVIVAILASLAAPSFSSFMNNTRQSSAQSQLFADLNRARSEAIKRNARILVCTTADGITCSTSTNWSSNWMVCYDVDADNNCDPTSTADPNPLVLRGGLHNSLTLTVSAPPVRFNPNGTQGSGGSVTLSLDGSWDGALPKTLNVSATGNISR